MGDRRPKASPEQLARRARIVLAGCVVFLFLLGAAFMAYAWDSHHDYSVRTSPPGGVTTTVVVDEVTTGRFCSATGKTSNCSPEYTLTYVVDQETHRTAMRKHLHAGVEVHAFEGSDGKWYVTEDPGFGNSSVAWVVWAAIGAAAIVIGLLCVRARMKVPKPAT
jgi:hypothetical protein